MLLALRPFAMCLEVLKISLYSNGGSKLYFKRCGVFWVVSGNVPVACAVADSKVLRLD